MVASRNFKRIIMSRVSLEIDSNPHILVLSIKMKKNNSKRKKGINIIILNKNSLVLFIDLYKGLLFIDRGAGAKDPILIN